LKPALKLILQIGLVFLQLFVTFGLAVFAKALVRSMPVWMLIALCALALALGVWMGIVMLRRWLKGK
jgi:hypothetical protein